jgi:hypothetical protein
MNNTNYLSEWKHRYYYILRNKTSGKLYLGQTVQSIEKYKGGGLYWKKHCKKYGGWNLQNIEVIFSEWFTSKEKAQEFLDFMLEIEPEYCRGGSNKKWANLCAETVYDSPFMGGDVVKRLVEEGTHQWLGKGYITTEKNLKRVKDGTHPFTSDNAKKWNKKRVEEGTHLWVGGNQQRELALKRIAEGTFPSVGMVFCIDRSGNFISIPKEKYRSQTGDQNDWEYVFVRSKEANRRKALISNH